MKKTYIATTILILVLVLCIGYMGHLDRIVNTQAEIILNQDEYIQNQVKVIEIQKQYIAESNQVNDVLYDLLKYNEWIHEVE